MYVAEFHFNKIAQLEVIFFYFGIKTNYSPSKNEKSKFNCFCNSYLLIK